MILIIWWSSGLGEVELSFPNTVLANQLRYDFIGWRGIAFFYSEPTDLDLLFPK